jgi:hypothetical protein
MIDALPDHIAVPDLRHRFRRSARDWLIGPLDVRIGFNTDQNLNLFNLVDPHDASAIAKVFAAGEDMTLRIKDGAETLVGRPVIIAHEWADEGDRLNGRYLEYETIARIQNQSERLYSIFAEFANKLRKARMKVAART